MRLRATGLAILLASVMAAPAFAGSWKYERDKQDHAILTYSEDDKVTFFLACGHTFALHLKYPGEAKMEGEASIVVATARQSMTLKGDFEELSDDLATTFAQYDLGYARQDPALYGKKWEKLRDRLLDLLDSGRPLKISSGKDSYTLPPIEAKGWRRALGECG